MTLLERVVEALAAVTPDYIDEYTLQAQLVDALEHVAPASLRVSREVILSDGASRIDILVEADAFTIDVPSWTVGVEVKTNGRHDDVVRQITRYLELPDLDALVLATTRAKHHRLPTEINGKPVRLVTYITSGI